MSVRVSLDFRTLRGKLWDMRDRLISTTENPDIKTDIYQYVYDNFVSEGVPHDTGALEDSPLQNFSISGPYAKYRYAHGGIGPDGIVFDPIQETGDEDTHYAQYVMYKTAWSPYKQVDDNMEDIKEYVKEVMVKELNDE